MTSYTSPRSHGRSLGPGLALTAAIAVSAALIAPTASAAPGHSARPAAAPADRAGTAAGAVAKPVAKPEDFNGDGYRDVAVSASRATVNGHRNAGYVAVLYGSKSTALPAKRQIIHQDTPGIPGTAEPGDGYGSTLAASDLDRDGYTDLLVESSDGTGADGRHGMISAVWGGRGGLKGSAVVARGSARDRIGSVLTGDFDGDRNPDFATVLGAETDDGGHVTQLRVSYGPFTRAGTAARVATAGERKDHSHDDLVAGDLNGDGRTDVVAVREWIADITPRPYVEVRMGGAKGLSGTATRLRKGDMDLQGRSLGIGDVNKDGFKDIVMGGGGRWSTRPGDHVLGGLITFVPGSAQGAVPQRAAFVHQNTPGVPGTDEMGDGFGVGVSVGDINGDGYADVSTGVQYEDLDGVRDAGAVVTLRGSKSGLTGAGATSFSQNTAGVPGAAEAMDQFGTATKLVDLDNDKRAELLVGAPHENASEGAVWILRATKSGITPKGAVTFGSGTLGMKAPRGWLGTAFNR
ncbi:FG-GAP and VCBS repeat-containing protein [Streptomyces sp. CAU 1734]|uniref:FG-GAP and VCBS repeat-containing protein n=1 Tax=Streptomyces sp. CAU 1734 TaxID=3140360 RepID=UPI0032619AA2